MAARCLTRTRIPGRLRSTERVPFFVDMPKKTVPGSLPSLGSGPAAPVMPTPRSALLRGAAGVGHGPGGLPADCAVAVEDFGIDAVGHLGRVGVGERLLR